jgi:hypothetical protein
VLRLFELARLGVLGAAESAFFIPEKCGFEEGVRNGRAVDGDKRPLEPSRLLVDIACHDFLAHAALAGQQDGGIALRDTPCEVEKISGDRIDGDDPIISRRLRQAIANDMFQQCLRFEGLEQEVAGACPHGFDSAVDVGESGHQDNRQVRKAAAYFLQQGNAVHREHAYITDDQRHGTPGEQLQRLVAACGGHRLLPGQFEGVADRLTQG